MNKILAAFLFVSATILIALGISTFTAHKAEAANISCGSGVVCYVDSTQHAGSSGGSGSTGGSGGTLNPNPGGGGGGGGGSTQPVVKVQSRYVDCGYWYGVGGHDVNTNYPVPGSPSAVCASNAQCVAQGGRAPKGLTYFWVGDDKNINTDPYSYFSCVYPTDAYYYPTVYNITRVLGGQGWFYATGGSAANAQAYGSSGILSDQTGYRASNFQPSNPGFSSTLDESFNARTYTVNGAPYYGYYRLQWLINYRDYQVTEYPAWMGQPSKYDVTSNYSRQTVDPYTYACNYTPPMRAGIVGGAKFDAAQCQTSTWKCTVTGNIAINGSSNNMVVMRNGDKLSVTFPSFNISGNGAKNMRNKQTLTSVNTNSVSPVNPNASDANNSRQYFDASWVWNSWQNYKQTGNWLAFYWSSDNGKNFKFTQQYKFTADFLVPTQGTINGPTVNKWVTDTTSCGGTKNSPQVTVARSIGD